jgi:hypothetical protein
VLADHVVVNKEQAATLRWNCGLESNRIKGWRLHCHPFSTFLARAGARELWQSQAHFSLAQEVCLLFLHDQLMLDP